jgi:hypothetical protein
MDRNASGTGAVAAADPRKRELAGASFTFHNSLALSDLQERYLARRLHISREVARLVAEIAFQHGRRL